MLFWWAFSREADYWRDIKNRREFSASKWVKKLKQLKKADSNIGLSSEGLIIERILILHLRFWGLFRRVRGGGVVCLWEFYAVLTKRWELLWEG